MQKVFTAVSDYTGPEVLKFLEAKAQDKTMEPYAKLAIKQLKALEKEAPVVEAGQLLATHRQIARADGVVFDPEIQAMVQWEKPSLEGSHPIGSRG